ncbi:MAG: flavin reductase family protein [Clostridia bacterium]|nr:flavin reductase family protein [Clostridia bacterium]
MSKIKWKGGTILAPVPPALVSCGSMESPNMLTVAWTGIVNSDPPMTYVSIRPSRYSYDIIKESGEFAINLPSSHIIRSIDFCGVRSGRDVNKFEACHLTPEKATTVSCPMVAESPLSLECRVTQIIPLGSHDMFLAEIVAVNVSETLIDDAGKLHLEKAALAAYSHGEYFALGKKIGSFGYSVKKKKGISKTQKSKNSPQKSIK